MALRRENEREDGVNSAMSKKEETEIGQIKTLEKKKSETSLGTIGEFKCNIRFIIGLI